MHVRRAERDAVVRAVEGQRPVVLTGPAGVGKTTLALDVLADRSPVAHHAARASLSWLPFGVFRSPAGGREAAPDDVERVVGRVLRGRPAALLVDDLQWADDASLAVALRLGRFVPVVATVRTGGVRSIEVVAALRAGGYDEVPVALLGEDDARRLVASRHPGLGPDERDDLVARAAGNPLLLVELARAGRLSPTLAHALYARLDLAGPECRRTFLRLSVLDRPCPDDLAGDGVDELIALGVARRGDGGVVVAHDLLAAVAEAAAGEEAAEVRRRLAAEVGAAEGAHLLARAGDRAAARQRALHAAATADGRDRAELLGLAVACGEAGDPDVDLRVEAARAHLAASDPGPAAALVTLSPDLLTAVDPASRGRLALTAVHVAVGLQDFAAFDAAVAEAWPLLVGTDSPEEVDLLAVSTLRDTRVELDGRPVLDRARAAVSLADRIGARRGYARSRLGSVLLTAGDPAWADTYGEALALAAEEGDRAAELAATESFALGLWVSGDVARAREVAARTAARLDGGPLLVARAYIGLFDLLVGRDPAAVVAAAVPVLEEEQSFRCRPFLEAAAAIARADLGQVAAAQAQLRGAHVRAGDHGQWRSVVAWAEAEVAWAAGDMVALAAAAGATAALGVGDYPPAALVRTVLAHARVEAGEGIDDIAPATGIFPAWAAFADEWEGLARAARGDHGAAVTSFAAAAAGWAGRDERGRARCLWAAGEAARRAGADDAADRLERAREEAEAGSIVGLAARARRSLREVGRSGGTPAAAGAATGPAPLTAREVQMLELVAVGRTSAQIAAELRLSRATVDQVVGAATRKLGAPNRRSAAALWVARARG